MDRPAGHTRLQQYLNLVAELAAIEADIAGLTTHRGDRGAIRERVIVSFLANHIPKRLRALVGGTIFNATGDESNQIDVVIAADLAANFELHEKMFIAVENVGCAVTVKSVLDKQALGEALSNLASIPQLDPRVVRFAAPMDATAFSMFANEYPSLFVFAFDGMTAETCLAHLMAMLHERPEIPLNRYPFSIIVNRKYSITYHRRPARTKLGTLVHESQFALAPLTPETQGHPFAQMLTAASRYTGWLQSIGIDMDVYFRLAYGVPAESTDVPREPAG